MQCANLKTTENIEITQLLFEKNQLTFELSMKQKEVESLKEKLFAAYSIQDENLKVENCGINERNQIKKVITINGQSIYATIDTGSDYTIIRDDVISDRAIPCNRTESIDEVKGVGGKTTFTGKFPAKIRIDKDIHEIVCYILSQGDIDEEMIIGLDIINNCTVEIKPGKSPKLKKVKKSKEESHFKTKWRKKSRRFDLRSTQNIQS